MHREREGDRQTDRDRQKDRQKERDRQTDRQRERDRECKDWRFNNNTKTKRVCVLGNRQKVLHSA